MDQNDDVFWNPFSSVNNTTTTTTTTSTYTDNFISDSDSDDDNNNNSNYIPSTTKRLDYMIQFLDRKLSVADDKPAVYDRPLPEFVANGGGTGIFKPPLRAAVHPNRPPSLEVRPHPLREMETGRALRTIAANETQLWGGGESGVRVWEFKDMFSSSCMFRVDEGEDAAPYSESALGVSETVCMVGDEASGGGGGVVWTGHRDGRIRCWKSKSGSGGIDEDGFKEMFSWQAHRGPVLSIVMTVYGDLWSGSEGGVIKIWPWEAIEKALSLTKEERHISALVVERSYIDLRSQITANGFSNVLSYDIKCLLSDNSRAKVWSAGNLSFALWDARTRELLKVFNVDGQIENRVDMSDFATEDEVKLRFNVTNSKKELGFFQRSRNAIMGAADAVRRVAAKGGFGDENRKTEALAITAEGIIWSGCANGLLIQWDANGNRLQDFQFHSHAIQCLCTFGSRIWVGYVSGMVQVLDLEGNHLGGWVAHSSAVIKMAFGAGYIFTLASHGGIRGWNITSPGPIDSVLRSELIGKEFLYTKIETLKILAGTWNVGQGRASQDSLLSWLGSAASDASIVVVGLQEVEMGAGFLAVSAAKETVGLEGSSVGNWWLEMIDKTLGEGLTFERIGSRQLAGLLIAVWVRQDLKAHVGDVDAAAVPCGFGRAIGNKGAVGVRIRVYDRIMCFVNCHFAAHLEAVNRRNADFDHVYRSMSFGRQSSTLFNNVTAGASSAVQMFRGTNGATSLEIMPELSEADMVIFLGDFNYRLDGITYDEARDFVSQRSFDWLKERDQLRVEMEAGNVFQGMHEAVIKFPPTYKFDKHLPGLAAYDSGEKKRIPAWCDRILYRDSRSTLISECSLECPVVASVTQYEACIDVTDSDHKPVRCKFRVDIARVDESIRRQEYGDIMGSNEKIKRVLGQLCKVPETVVSTNNIIIQNQDTSILRITNKSGEKDALFEIICEGQSTVREDGKASDLHSRGSFGFPRWLEVTPSTGIIKPDHIAEITVHHEDFNTQEEFIDGVPQNWWCEYTRDKEVILIFKIRGSYSTDFRNHRVRVRHCCSGNPTHGGNSASSGPKQSQPNLLHRADYERLSGSHDVFDHLKDLQSP
ncbi:hypothetical protein ACFE04_027481 [Oxalis oulophora]